MKNILVCVSGSTPQIVTETVYALLHEKEPFIPDEIHIITTKFGKNELVKGLLKTVEGIKGQYYQLAEEYQLPWEKIRFNSDTIHVVEDSEGNELNDIRSVEDNDHLADKIVDLVRGFTEEDDQGRAKNRVYASLAGGRKTMGFFLGHAMTLFAHEDDCLSHIIVTEGFEHHPNFFFPPKKNRVLEVKNRESGKVTGKLNTDDAEISFAKIPFVRLREGLDKVLLEGKSSYSETVALAQQDFGDPQLLLNYKKRSIICGDKEIKLSPVKFSLYAVFSQMAKEKSGYLSRDEWTDNKVIDAYHEVYNRVKNGAIENPIYPDNADKFEALKNRFDENKSRLNKDLEIILGASQARSYQINEIERRNKVKIFGLVLSANQIKFEGS